MLEFQRVCKLYESPAGTIRAVDDLSLKVDAGELVAVFGPSGSGKSTLLLLAAGLLQADAGTVCAHGKDLAKLPKREVLEYRRTTLGFVFQNFNLVPGLSAEENVALPLLLRGVHRNDANRRAQAALAEVGLTGRAKHTIAQLSGGEQQRVSIARALVGEPRLVLADEPTGNLDSDTGYAILDLLAELPRRHGVALVLVTHDARVAGYADRTLTMRDGALAPSEPAISADIGP